VRYESSSLSERVQKTALLAPLVGIFLALWDCYQAAAAAGQAAAGQAGGSSCSSRRLLTELAEMADERFMSSLRFLQARVCCAALCCVCVCVCVCWPLCFEMLGRLRCL
jgi:hypothetical protein